MVVHFWAPWAPQCAQMNGVMLELAREHPQVSFLKVLRPAPRPAGVPGGPRGSGVLVVGAGACCFGSRPVSAHRCPRLVGPGSWAVQRSALSTQHTWVSACRGQGGAGRFGAGPVLGRATTGRGACGRSRLDRAPGPPGCSGVRSENPSREKVAEKGQ